jgi:hypothetical protein
MTLGKAQELFGYCLGELLVYIHLKGYQVRIGDAWSLPHDTTTDGKPRHKKNSQHHKKLAIDLNLFKNGKFLSSTEDHRDFGIFWEKLSPFCRWGGRYNDGNHYEVIEKHWREELK